MTCAYLLSASVALRVHELKKMVLNDLKEHKRKEVILCLFLKVPTGPRKDRETEKENVKKNPIYI